ncbi:MAG: HAMP domain-containing protein, partial [Anaerolineales bacterium]|nr:HAMP domain-containing protein [Anaerolineales bacterium]
AVRLFAAFSAVIVAALAAVGLALLLFLRDSPLVERGAVTRLNEVARLLARQTPLAAEAAPAEVRAYLREVAETYAVRVVVFDANGRTLTDSQPDSPALRFQVRAAQASAVLAEARLGRARAEDGEVWTVLARPLNAGRWLALAVAQPRYPLLTFFLQDLLRPLLQAGLIALGLALVLAGLVARSIAHPLHQMAAAAQRLARGEYTRQAPAGGPDEVRALGQALDSMAGQIQATQQTQLDFLGNVSHELKTPLTSIQGFAQAIQDGAAASPEAVQRSAHIIYEESDRLRRLVEELLELTRLDAGLRALRRAPVDLSLLLPAVVEKFQLRAREKPVTLSLELTPQLPLPSGDADRLAQVFTNLVDNALKHTPAGGRVLISAAPAPEGVQIAVADTGAGIPAEDLGRVFERFYQVDKSRARSGGVGLGLAISQEIVQAHGGQITAESVLGLGTRFTVRLPLAQPPAGGKRPRG